ncbi:uncharacterized RDD family membrane protein YckC/uncharacterized protein YoaH (UPF0181 family) [Sphingomonas sp. UYAg733]
MRWPFRRKDRGPKSMRRSFVTPEGVDLQLELGGAGVRAAAFMIDAVAILVVLIVLTIIITLLFVASESTALAILWLIGFFILRNGWFVLFEMGGRGATPGKRLLGLRVVARDGARLTGGAVLARNAMREIEVFLPLSFLAAQTAQGMADSFLVIFALSWSGIFLFFPLFNRDRLRVGDLVAGTWVVRTVSGELGADIVGATERPRWTFTDAELSLYGEFELQTLENVLRGGRDDAIATVAATIRAKAGMEDSRYHRAGDDFHFLSDYYAALCARLERGMMVGRRRADKFASSRDGRTVGPISGASAEGAITRPRRVFSDVELSLYGEFELRKLQDVLRAGNAEAIATVAAMIRARAGVTEPAVKSAGDDFHFLSDYQAALSARIERGTAIGSRHM